MNVVFMGTPAFAATCLDVLHQSQHVIKAVVTRPDRPQGRGRKIASPAVKIKAEQLGLPILQPESLLDATFMAHLDNYAPDLFVVVAFVILPPALIGVPARGAVNLHASLLPDYRGAAPIQWAVINGEQKTGLTTFLIEEKVDTGNIMLQHEMEISPNETAGELTLRMEKEGAELLVRTLDLLEQDSIALTEQRMLRGKRAPKLKKVDGKINWQLSAQEIHNRIRGCSPVPGAFTRLNKKQVKVFAGRVEGLTFEGKPGEIIGITQDGLLQVVCGDSGVVSLGEIQREGKRRMPARDFICGVTLASGVCFD